MKFNILVIILLVFPKLHLNAQEECFTVFYNKGIEYFNKYEFDTALNNFKAAEFCDDAPKNSNIKIWIDSTKNAYITALKNSVNQANSNSLFSNGLLAINNKDFTQAFWSFYYSNEVYPNKDAKSFLHAIFSSDIKEFNNKNILNTPILKSTLINDCQQMDRIEVLPNEDILGFNYSDWELVRWDKNGELIEKIDIDRNHFILDNGFNSFEGSKVISNLKSSFLLYLNQEGKFIIYDTGKSTTKEIPKEISLTKDTITTYDTDTFEEYTIIKGNWGGYFIEDKILILNTVNSFRHENFYDHLIPIEFRLFDLNGSLIESYEIEISIRRRMEDNETLEDLKDDLLYELNSIIEELHPSRNSRLSSYEVNEFSSLGKYVTKYILHKYYLLHDEYIYDKHINENILETFPIKKSDTNGIEFAKLPMSVFPFPTGHIHFYAGDNKNHLSNEYFISYSGNSIYKWICPGTISQFNDKTIEDFIQEFNPDDLSENIKKKYKIYDH